MAEQVVETPAVPVTESLNTAAPPRRPPFVANRNDGLFALVAFALGFAFTRWVFFSWQGYGVTLFTAAYAATVTIYLRQRGAHFSRAAWFWLGVLLLTGQSFSLWQSNGLQPWRSLFLFLTAVYWVLSATGMSVLGRTSDWLLLDGLHGLVVVPLLNFGDQYRSLAALRRQPSPQKQQTFLSLLLGLLLGAAVIFLVLPLLMQADSGGFAAVTDGLWRHLRFLQADVVLLLIQLLLAIPVAAYLFGLVAGSARRRGAPGFGPEPLEHSLRSFRMLPLVSVCTMLGLVSGIYLLFIGCQLPYFFSAFVGARPEGWLVYSEYARKGFFELLNIAIINLTVLAAANLGSERQRRESLGLRLLNSLLALLTMLLIATAMSKMALYIQAYGLSVPRLLPCVFMLVLAVVCAGVVALQRRQFSIMRLTAITAAVAFTLLSLTDPDGLVARYNADRYLAGTLSQFDVEILHRAGPAGVNAALRVYAATDDAVLQSDLDKYLQAQRAMAHGTAGRSVDSLQNLLVRRKLNAWQTTK